MPRQETTPQDVRNRGVVPVLREVMDVWGDHALVCATKGDRTVRHNRIRDSVLDEGRKAGLELDKEKANLLPGRPDEDGILTKEQTGSTGRRPADIWWATSFFPAQAFFPLPRPPPHHGRGWPRPTPGHFGGRPGSVGGRHFKYGTGKDDGT